jgi:hypothetical protein
VYFQQKKAEGYGHGTPIRSIWYCRRAFSTEQYQSALRVGLLYWPLNCMPFLLDLYYSAEILFRNCLCLTEFDMEMGRPTHLQERDQVLLLCGRSLVFRWHLQVSGGRSGSVYLNHTAPHGAWRLLVVSRECGEILTETA